MEHDEPTMPPTELEVHESCPDCTADRLCDMHGKDPLLESFYRLTVKERDYERVRNARLAEENERLREALGWIAELAENDENGCLYLKHATAALAGREEGK